MNNSFVSNYDPKEFIEFYNVYFVCDVKSGFYITELINKTMFYFNLLVVNFYAFFFCCYYISSHMVSYTCETCFPPMYVLMPLTKDILSAYTFISK